MINKISEAKEVMQAIDESKVLLPFNDKAMVALLNLEFGESADIDMGVENLRFSYSTLIQDTDLIKSYNKIYLYLSSRVN